MMHPCPKLSNNNCILFFKQEKNGPRNPLALLDDVCIYDFLQFTEKIKFIISGGYFADSILSVVQLPVTHETHAHEPF